MAVQKKQLKHASRFSFRSSSFVYKCFPANCLSKKSPTFVELLCKMFSDINPRPRDGTKQLTYLSEKKPISPLEVESVIRQHPAVQDVAVTGIPDAECGELPVACVVVRPGHTVTAQEIKDLVKDNLTDTKQLRGGVIFLNEIPMTVTTKIHRRKLKEMVLTMDKE